MVFSHELPNRLTELLGQPAPGRDCRARFAPQLAYGRHMGPSAPDARPASVLLLLFRRQGQWRLPLTVRQSNLPDHAGQVSLPGGMLEGQESSCEGALRESEEEVGIDANSVQVLGHLSPLYVFNSNFLVTPWVGLLPDEPAFQEDKREVAELFEVPLEAFLDRQNHDRTEIVRGDFSFTAPCFQWDRFTIWGATSIILGEFLAILEQATSGRTEPKQ
jgi:8-oxo-dGTP pyrophosphatase MutT (NUDIX family)